HSREGGCISPGAATTGREERRALERAIKTLTAAGTLAGLGVIVYGLALFFAAGSIPALLVAVSVIVVGPVEDVLQNIARQRIADKKAQQAWVVLVDRATSLAFLVLLLLTLYAIR